MSNVKAGDFARAVHMVDGNTDRFFEVLYPFRGNWPRAPGIWWVCNALGPVFAENRQWPPGRKVVCHNSNLRPIRDLGDDAQDEMLRQLPKVAPARQEVPA